MSERLPAQSLTDFAVRCLRQDIVSCALMPGQAVSEAVLAARYNLGKAPIRAALSRLSEAGLVRGYHRRGYVVAPVTVKEVVEAFDLRLLLEPHAARRAAGRMSQAAIDDFDRAYRAFRPGDAGTENEFLRANRAFHVGIAEAAGMDKLGQILGDLIDCTERVIRIGLAEWRGPKPMEAHHRAFAAVLLSGDGEDAARLAAESIELGRRMVMDAILKTQAVSDVALVSSNS